MQISLVTGGAGFLGSHICDRLIEEGHHVICMDNLLTGSKKNIDQLFDHDRFTFLNHDVTETIDLPKLLEDKKDTLKDTKNLTPKTKNLDNIFHFASPASPKDYQEYPIHTLKVGALGTHHALGLAKAANTKFLLASSSEVYGDPQVNPQPEDYWGHVNPVGPRSAYDEAKRYGESITMAYHNKHNIDTRIARIFNTYGSRMRLRDGRALPNFMRQAIKGKPLTVFGDGSQTRSFCFVDDMVEGIISLLTWNPTPNAKDLTPVFNLGNPDEISILEFANEVIEITDTASEITHEPLPENDPQVRRPDISKAKELLDWSPEVSRRKGLNKVLPYFKEQINKEA
ncbi:SDR family oxidoreductase [Candidatus Bipolaricaulota bacterium]|nr:SDR family oxidoreductase [Candidatus Bipolaricaulota bacterium]